MGLRPASGNRFFLRTVQRLAAALAILVGLAACGQKGPLYLPQPEKSPEESSEPAQQ